MTDETNGSGVGEQELDGVRCELCGVVRTNAIYSHHGVIRCQDWNVCEQVVALVAGARSSYADLIEAGWKPTTPDADDASGPTWMRPIPEAMMNDERLDVLLSEFYHSDGGDYVSALGDIRKHVAARVSAAATRARAEGAAAERERIAQAIEALPTYYAQGTGGGWLQTVRTDAAARIARREA